MIFLPISSNESLSDGSHEAYEIVICDYVIEELRLVTRRKFPHKGA